MSIGTNVLRPSIGLFGDGGGDLKFLLGVQHVRSWLNDRGGQWRNNLQIGYQSLLSTRACTSPSTSHSGSSSNPDWQVGRSVEEVYVDGDNIATYQFRRLWRARGSRLEHRRAPRNCGSAMAPSSVTSTVQTGTPLLPEADFTDAGLMVTARYDSRNAPSFATKGIAAQVDYRMIDDSLGSDRNWESLEAGFRTALPFGKNVMWLSFAGGTDLGGDLPADRACSRWAGRAPSRICLR